MNSLLTLRDKLGELNSDLFLILKKRKEISRKIQALKKTSSSLDIRRELTLFSEAKADLLSLSDKELLSFSLIMESQAGENYPSWSTGIHLQDKSSCITEMINPFLLKILGRLGEVEKSLNDEYLSMIQKEVING